jgi:DNA invertase Pin-like site-specific DNA recombinase
VPDSVALYLRVSTSDQDLLAQESDLRTYARSRNWDVEVVYSEKVSANGKVAREAHQQLLNDAGSWSASAPKFNRVLVWSLDRWSRDPSFVQAIGSIEALEAMGKRFHSLKEPGLDTGEDPKVPNLGRDLLRGILPVIAAFEARRRSERTKLAMTAFKTGARTPRGPIGRPRRVTPELAERAYELHRKGRAWSTIAQHVGLKPETARRAARAWSQGWRGGDNPPVGQKVEPTSAQPQPTNRTLSPTPDRAPPESKPPAGKGLGTGGAPVAREAVP